MESLFLAHRAPFPPDKGDRLRAFRHLKVLARFGPVDIIAPADSREDARIAEEGLAKICRDVWIYPRRHLPAFARVGLSLLTGGSLTEAWFGDRRVQRTMDECLRNHDYDLVYAFSSGTGPWWRRAKAGHKIMDLCDVDALKWEALSARSRGIRSWLYATEAHRLLPREIELAETADLILVSTPQEAADLQKHSTPRRLQVLTNGSPWEGFVDIPPPSSVGPCLGFLGQMDYPPNVLAAKYLARKVLPLVRETVPEASLKIFGRCPTSSVRALQVPGQVEVTGEVADLPEALGSLRTFVAPLDAGRGIPTKILEAMVAGRPTIISSWSARALDGEEGVDYLVADGVEDRADAVVTMLQNPEVADAMGERGRKYVRQHHDWDVVLDHLEALVREVTDA
ncbi:MAG: glycosyltransferase family 4 protein [Planctomycetota bacterium]|nr:glycosyltransferase family 4 protein [Planctomycetota bacterium]